MLVIKIKKIEGFSDIKTPEFAHPEDAGVDLFSRERVEIKKGHRVQIPTGICMEIPEGYAGFVWDKSGLSHKYGLKTVGGVIDSGYRGEVLVGIINLGEKDFVFEKNQKIAQMIIQKVEHPAIELVDKLVDTDRGTDGFGSTGK